VFGRPGPESVTLELVSSPTGDVVSVDITLPNGTTTTVTRTGTGVVNTDATALAASIDALAQITASAVGAVITVVTTAAGDVTTFANLTSHLKFKDATSDPATGIATDLAAIAAVDNDFYGLHLAVESEAIVNAAASWANSNKKLFGFATMDWGVQDAATTTDVLSDVKSNAYDHVYGTFNSKKYPSYQAAAMSGDRFPYVPGGSTWEYKTMIGVPVDSLTTTQKNALRGKNCSFYTSMAGISVMQNTKVASGEWIDVIHFNDWQVAEIQFRVYSILVNNGKVPFTDIGIDAVVAAI
jgi:hypothetical protein